MTNPEPKDWHDEPWAEQAALLDRKTAMSLLDAVSLITSRTEAISDGLETELTVFAEAVQRSHRDLKNYRGIWASDGR